MKCPVCVEQSLARKTYEGVAIFTCPDCDGSWVGTKELEHIKETREETFGHMEAARTKLKVLRQWKVTVDEEKKSSRKCPDCDRLLTSIHYERIPGLLVEKCSGDCGYWLDKGELEKLQLLAEME